MKHLLPLLLLFSLTLQAQDAPTRRARLEQHVYFLAADSLHGRQAGSEDAAKARQYLDRQYEAMGIEPWMGQREHPFKNKPNVSLSSLNIEPGLYTNLISIIPGNDPVLKDEYIVLGAHYDHIGMSGDEVFNGADDNASGTAALVEIARELMARRDHLKRSILIAAFDAEELGLYGSGALAEELDTLGINVRLMMSIDMVGWLKAGGALTLEGTGTIRGGKQILSSHAERLGLNIKGKPFETSIMTATDTEGFAIRGIPTLAVTTGLKSPYHKPGDDAELIDYDGLDLVCQYLTDITDEFASDTAFGPSGRLSFKHRSYAPCNFRFGVTAALTANTLEYPKASAVTGKGLTASDGLGLTARLNMGHFALMADALAGCQSYLLADPNYSYLSAFRFRQTSVTVPVTLALQTYQRGGRSSSGAWIGFGAWYRYVHNTAFLAGDGSWVDCIPGNVGSGWAFDRFTTPSDQLYGWHMTLGVNVYNVAIEARWLWGLNPVFGPDPAGEVKPNSYSAVLKWYF